MNENNLKLNNEYVSLVREIKEKIQKSRIKASVRVNSELILMYWKLGELIARKQSETKWSDGLIKQLSKDLISEFPNMKGFSTTNLFYIKKWYLFYFSKKEELINIFENLNKSENLPQVAEELYTAKNQLIKYLSSLYEIIPQVVGDYFNTYLPQLLSLIPWRHHREIITKCKSIETVLY